MVEAADGRIPWPRFEALVDGAVVASDPDQAARAEDEAAQEQFAKTTRTTEAGIRGFYVRATFPVIARLDAMVGHLADLLAAQGDTDPLDVRRVTAILLLTDPAAALQLMDAHHRQRPEESTDVEIDWPALLPAVQIFLHVYAGTHAQPSEGIARVEGIGAVTESWLRTHLPPQTTVTVTPVVDPEGQAPVDSHEIPDRHRRAVKLMTPADTFPFAPSTRRGKQIDHTVPYQSGAPPGTGQSRIGNDGPMTPYHHRVKTFGHRRVEQPFPGIYLWRDPHGTLYLVDHTGTRRLPATA